MTELFFKQKKIWADFWTCTVSHTEPIRLKCKIYLSLTNPIRLNLLHLTIWKVYYIILYYNNNNRVMYISQSYMKHHVVYFVINYMMFHVWLTYIHHTVISSCWHGLMQMDGKYFFLHCQLEGNMLINIRYSSPWIISAPHRPMQFGTHKVILHKTIKHSL